MKIVLKRGSRMTIISSLSNANSMPADFINSMEQQKEGVQNNKEFNPQKQPQTVDISSIPTQFSDINSNSIGGLFRYQEEINYSSLDTQIAFKGKDGVQMFINYSYQSISKKVQYEVAQNYKKTEDDIEVHKHPFDDYFGPKATANRILDFAKGLINKFQALEGKDNEKMEKLINDLIRGIENGFKEARKILGALPQDIAGMINETHDRIMKGINEIKQGLSGEREVQNSKITYKEEITYTKESLEISIIA